ncbi:hypothetical protein FNV43_RR17606 [Rhamnella rubrinervis]|uniref:Uncharacterized protein n=1 Tax=Rhamnella rubrinervis TaxID=2594499 RepID=A0A8K0GV04_9ROSA|nr:hypothetical protein FNV43_RR17606 [Rhamnella rubrinervis]
MSVSLEALAMAGVDYHEAGICIEEWEAEDLEETPAHLLAEEEEEEEGGRRGGGGGEVGRDNKYGCVRYPSYLKNINRHAKHNDGCNGDCKDNEDDLVTIKRNQNVGFDGMVDAIKVMVRAISRLL